MTFSKPLLGTAPNKVKMNWWEYYMGHCWMTGWQSISSNFRMWSDLMGSNYEGYALLKENDSEAECLYWFWESLVEDDVYSKEFLEYLMQMVDDIDTGKEEVIPMDEDFFDRLKDLTDEEDEENDE